jgi:glycosyltransferase involved in cell wall biosynthesis
LRHPDPGKKKILLFADWYEPGFRAGGPIRSCVNFARHMQEVYEVYVFTTDRDLGSPEPYKGIRPDEWAAGNGGINVFYCSPANLGWHTVSRQMSAVGPDYIYLNSMFSVKFTIFPLLIERLSGKKYRIILSPRGMLRSSAVQFKSGKKKLFLNSFRWLGFHKKVAFLAADDTEVKDVRRYFGQHVRVTKIPNFPAALSAPPDVIEKNKGDLTLIYIGRIHPIKNLDYLLNVLKEARANIRLTIAGSVEDEAFWLCCREIIQGLPANITVNYAGEIPYDGLPALTAQQHIFALPTKGENFGHAIFEALALGKPVLISDQTPWRGLRAAGAGWDLSLDRPDEFRRAIEEAAAFDQQEYGARCAAASKYIENYIAGLDLKEAYIKLFS